MNPGFQLIENSINSRIKSELDKVGLLYRLFSRAKDENSITEKINRKIKEGHPYSECGKKLQDIIGVRIVTYFKDDISLVKNILSSKFNYIDCEIDDLDLTVFKPKRTNIICSFNKEQALIIKEMKKDSSTNNIKLVDETFELQLRTILSEGWHEIDHSLRYKCKDDWKDHKENERLLNGIYASLEINDIALKNLFNELAYKHFKNGNWEALIRNKFRLNFQLKPLNEDLIEILNNNHQIGKNLVKLDREEVLIAISNVDLPLPINFNNLLYMLNEIIIKDEKIREITPQIIRNYTQHQISPIVQSELV